MSLAIEQGQGEGRAWAAQLPGAEIRGQVWTLLGNLYPNHELVERRSDQRFPFPYLVRLLPVAEDGSTPVGSPMVVVGKHLSEWGLGFYHHKPLVYRRVIATLDAAGRPMSFLLDLTWCRFTRQGWYESGGRFLQPVPTPTVDY